MYSICICIYSILLYVYKNSNFSSVIHFSLFIYLLLLFAERLGSSFHIQILFFIFNSLTDATVLNDRLAERVEWRHGRTFVPRANKRLMLFIDDLHAKGSAAELIRQHIDDGGFYEPSSLIWRYVKNVLYVACLTPGEVLSPRLLRHFAILHVPKPEMDELDTIFSTLLCSHFTPNGKATHEEDSLYTNRDEQDRLLIAIEKMIKVSCELQEKLAKMFLLTAERIHYIWNLRQLASIFRNVCLSVQSSDNVEDVLLLWRHECWNAYAARMINDVDIGRYVEAWTTGVRKYFDDPHSIRVLTTEGSFIFSNVIEHDSGIVMAGPSSPDRKDFYKKVEKVSRVRNLLQHAIDEYNKNQPRLSLRLYKAAIDIICRWSRLLAVEHSHMLVLADGCAGRTHGLIELSSYLAGYTTTSIMPSNVLHATKYSLESFKNDLVDFYTRAGVRGEKLVLVLNQHDIVDEDMIVLVCELVVHGEMSHLFSPEHVTTIINSVRTDVTQAGLTYTHQVAWQHFLKTVQKNVRVCVVLDDMKTIKPSYVGLMAQHMNVSYKYI